MEQSREDKVRIMGTYGLGSLLMLVLTGLFWTLVPFLMVVKLADEEPAIQEQLERVSVYQMDSLELDPHDPNMAKRREILAPVFARLDWFVVALITSVLTFASLGFFCGLLCGDPNWAGVLPFVAIITQRSPAVMANVMERSGFSGIGLDFSEQAGVLLLQLVVVYAGAFWGSEIFWRKANSER